MIAVHVVQGSNKCENEVQKSLLACLSVGVGGHIFGAHSFAQEPPRSSQELGFKPCVCWHRKQRACESCYHWLSLLSLARAGHFLPWSGGLKRAARIHPDIGHLKEEGQAEHLPQRQSPVAGNMQQIPCELKLMDVFFPWNS